VWTQAQTQPYAAQNVWMRDQFWPNTTLLLQGNGTNGAQNNTFLDSSTNNFTITRNGNTTQGSFTPYEANGYWSNYFSGSSDYIRFPNNAAFQFGSGDMTVEAWVFTTGQQVLYGGSISSYGTASSFNGWNLAITGSNETPVDRVIFAYNYSNAVYSTATIPRNQWVHIAATKSGTTLRLFINGVLDTSSTFNYSVSTGANDYAYVGTQGYDPGSSNRTFTGYISNVRVLKGTAQYTSAFTPSTTPLTAITNTSLLTAQSNRFLDNSTNAFAVTVNGTPSVQAFQPFPGATTWSGSVLGGSGYFDGSGDYLNGPNSGQFAPTGDFTISMWFYPTSFAASYYVLAGSWNTGTSDEWLIQYDNTGAIRFLTTTDSTFSAAGVVKLNQWQFLTVSRSGSTVTGYINGTSFRSYTLTGTVGSATKTVYIGAQQGTTWPYVGWISDYRLVSGSAQSATPPTSPATAISGTNTLLNFTNAGIFDSAMMNNLETVGNAQVSTSVVKYGTGSISLDGTGDWLIGPASQNLVASGDFTVEAWVYMNANSGSQTVITYANTSAQTQWGLFVGLITSGKASFYWVNTSPTGFNATGTTTIPTGQWVHIAGTLQGTTLRVFVNGVLEGTGTTSGSARSQSSPLLFVGQSGVGAETLNGYIDDLRITKGAARYIGNFTPPVARMPGQ